MKSRLALLLILPLLVACGQGDMTDQASGVDAVKTAQNVAGSDCCADAKDAVCCELATFALPGLDAARAGELAQALGKLPGVMKAKPDFEAGKFAVEYAAGPENLQAISALIESADARATLLGVTPVVPAEHAKSGCEGCPSRSACQGG